MCYILCTISIVCVAPGAQGFGGNALEIFFLGKCVVFFPLFSCCLDFCVHCWAVFQYMDFVDGFLFLVNELGLLTNLGHWVKVLDATGSYMYIVL
jgi:hypothetical protein